MKKNIITALLLLIVGLSHAQGIRFEEGLSWEQLKAKAKRENKYLFVDCYATWCAPCKFMSENIFTKNDVGEFFNANFINGAVQMDQTKNDSEFIKSWHGDTQSILKEQDITSYPTYLFFSPDGKIVHRLVGATNNPATFLTKARHALDPNFQYYNLKSQVLTHRTDSAFLRKALISALEASIDTDVVMLSNLYVDQVSSTFEKADLNLIGATINSSFVKAFGLFLNHASVVDSILSKPGWVEGKLSKILYKEELARYYKASDSAKNWPSVVQSLKTRYPAVNELTLTKIFPNFRLMVYSNEIKTRIYNEKVKVPDWKGLEQLIKTKYDGLKLLQMLDEEKPKYYASKEKWEDCAVTAVDYLDKYGEELSDRDLNNFTWDCVFVHSNDQSLLKKALTWSKRAVDIAPGDHQNLDTFANLLYKTGDRKAAIINEKRAIELLLSKPPVNTEDLKELSKALKKMENNEKTWQ